MTEELSTFWSVWVTLIILGSIFGSWALLHITHKNHDEEKENNETTGHAYDGIEEFDNPMPKWWIYMFVGSIIFGLGYLAVYPGLGNYKGLFNWTQYNQWETEVENAEKRYGPIFEEYAKMSIEDVIKNRDSDDEEISNKAWEVLESGERLFANNCAICHGVAGTGSEGFPNLADNDWLYGGSPEKIKETLVLGRNGIMPARGVAGNLTDEEIIQVSTYVRSFDDQSVDMAVAEQGKAIYSGKGGCLACHGVDAKGNQLLGAPNLTDDIWLYGGTQAKVEFTIRHGRKGVMPAHKELLGDDRIHVVAAYVYSLSKEEAE